MASKIPFATDLTDHGKTPANPVRKMKASRERTVKRSVRLVTVLRSRHPSSVPQAAQGTYQVPWNV